jgi:hypothetical protein
MIDELFLTLAPQMAGRQSAAPRLSRMFTPAIVVATGNSRWETSRAQPSSYIFICASAKEKRRFGNAP